MLRGVDFDVARGSIFALLGSNGAGKTTVVKILSTLLKADAGTAEVNGFDVGGQPQDVRESISLTGQFAAVDEILSGRENLVLVARLRHLPNPGQIADDLLARFALTEAGGRQGVDLLGRDAPPPRHRDEPDRGPAGHLPRRADDRSRPPGPHRGVADREGARRQRHDRAADDPVPGRSRTARRSDRDPARGRIIVNGTLAELKQLLPPAKVEYVEKQPSLEEVFLALVGGSGSPVSTRSSGGTDRAAVGSTTGADN